MLDKDVIEALDRSLWAKWDRLRAHCIKNPKCKQSRAKLDKLLGDVK